MLRIHVDGPIATVTLARPERRNALTPEMLEAISEAASRLDATPEVRAVILAGEGRSFCAGFDVDVLASDDLLAGTPGTRLEATDLGRRMADAWETMRPVSVAALHGHVVGGGLVLAAACDLRVAAADTVFLVPELDLGIPLGWGGIPRLVRELGPAKTKEVVMTCRPFGVDEAGAFVNRVVDPDAVLASARELAEEIAARPEAAVTLTKRHVNAVARHASGAGFSFADAAGLLAALAERRIDEDT